MDCEQVRELLSARIDGELTQPQRDGVEIHLAQCAACLSEWEALSSLHTSLSRSLVDVGETSSVVAAQAVTRWRHDPPHSNRLPQGFVTAIQLLAAVAAGFLLAVVWLGRETAQHSPELVVVPADDNQVISENVPPFVAHVVAATGPLLYRSMPDSDWQPVPSHQLATFACPSSGSLKTQPAALCELVNRDGANVRLNENTEVTWLAADEIQLVGGQVWCRAPSNGRLVLKTADASSRVSSWTCAPDSECMATLPEDGSCKVLAVEGQVTGTVNDQPQALLQGMMCTTSFENVAVQPSPEDVLLAGRWMQPLLTSGGYDNPELIDRADALLARIGRAKVSIFFEQDLRNLGQYAALPLLKYVQTSGDEADRDRRQAAMRILSDTAPIWMVPDLVELLDDDDGDIRRLAATALTRLTGASQGLSPADWEQEPAVWRDKVVAWREWWIRQRFSCPLPPPGVAPRDAAVPATESHPLLKARN